MKVPNPRLAKLAEKMGKRERYPDKFLDFGLLHVDSVSQEMPTSSSPVYSGGLHENEVNKEENVIEKVRN